MSRRHIRSSGMGEEVKKRLSTTHVIHKSTKTATISGQYADGTARAEMKIGPYTYAGFALMLRATAAIAGETFEDHGTHYVKTEFVSKYVESVSLELDNQRERHLNTDMLVNINARDGYDGTDGALHIRFGGPFQFDDTAAEDGYMLGTANRRSVELVFKLTNAWNDGSLFLEIMSEYAPVARPTSFFRSLVVKRKNVTASGVVTLSGTDFPIHADIGSITVLGSQIKSAKLEVDGIELINGTNLEVRQMEQLHNPQAYALGDGVVFDFLRQKQIGKGLRSLEGQAQRARNADISVELDMLAAEELVIVIDQIGRYDGQ